MSPIPSISIGMPVYNCQNTVEQSIRSILGQTFTDWELLIVDDGSTDDTVKVIRRFRDSRIHIWSHKTNMGLAVRLNETIEHSKGFFYARMDGDDVSYPLRLEHQLQFVESHSEVDLIGAWVMVFDKNGNLLGKNVSKINRKSRYIIQAIPIRHPTFFGRLKWFKKNRYIDSCRHSQDQLLLLSSIKESRFDIVPEILLGYRQGAMNIRKQINYRSFYFKYFYVLMNKLGFWSSLALVAVQLGKIGLDALMIGVMGKNCIFTSGSQPVTIDEKRQWQSVWKLVNEKY